MFPSLCCGDRKWVRIGLALLVFFVFVSLASAQTDNWVGTSGKWSDPTQWDRSVPVTGDNIVIGPNPANSTDDFSLAIGNLTLYNSTDLLTVADGVALTVSGTVANQGAISLASVGTNTYLKVTSTANLSGSGTLTLGTGGPNFITGASGQGTEMLSSANMIQGAGNSTWHVLEYDDPDQLLGALCDFLYHHEGNTDRCVRTGGGVVWSGGKDSPIRKPLIRPVPKGA